ncbi:hypothetical protein [Paenibacillus xerothermodurans]|uniref:hypothetical protein n=1 Tax=Paenibacillus xerothermodurans TaxID=1977292 RepID=UPI002699B081
MNMKVVNHGLTVGDVRIIEITNSSVLLIGDTEQVICSSIVDSPPESLLVGPLATLPPVQNEDAQEHDENEQEHDEAAQENAEDAQAHDEAAQENGEDAQEHDEAAQENAEDVQEHAKDAQENSEDEQENGEDEENGS